METFYILSSHMAAGRSTPGPESFERLPRRPVGRGFWKQPERWGVLRAEGQWVPKGALTTALPLGWAKWQVHDHLRRVRVRRRVPGRPAGEAVAELSGLPAGTHKSRSGGAARRGQGERGRMSYFRQ